MFYYTHIPKYFMKSILLIILLPGLLHIYSCTAKDVSSSAGSSKTEDSQTVSNSSPARSGSLILGADQMDVYLEGLKGKTVAVVVNQTSLVNGKHLVDTLLSRNIKVIKVFAPEHGFRGDADAGEHVKNAVDTKTNLPIISLYGSNKKPTSDQLKDVDVVVFDIQDVGARFYTYISTLHYVMEACAEQNKKVLVLDRPNPNGNYVDGPVLDMKFKSFVGMHPIPIVHGLTVGELAQMINGEKWLEGARTCEIEVVPVKNYTHRDTYSLPVKPSPNLPNDQSVLLYPSLCLFEGTIISLGRGTPFPFQVIGYPDERFGDFTFKPMSVEGASNPPYEGKKCFGQDLRDVEQETQLNLKYLINFYNKAQDKDAFFNNFFKNLAGNDILQKQIREGKTEAEIKESWAAGLDSYKQMRKRYLLYKDFD